MTELNSIAKLVGPNIKIDPLTKRIIWIFLDRYLEELTSIFRKLWQKEKITLEELDQFVEPISKIKKEFGALP